MTDASTETRSVVMERTFAHPPERLWRALTQPHLIAEWLMQADFRPEVGHRFDFSAEWGFIACRVLEIEPQKSLSYSWDAMGLESIVTWTLTPSDAGTLLRMEQVGFQPEQKQAYHGARAGWPRFLGRLEELLNTID